MRDELLDVEEFACLAEARAAGARDYNWRRPHTPLGMKAPAEFAVAWAEDQTALLAA